jgi:hypothetical protein
MMALSRGRTPSAATGACLWMAGTTTATATSTASTAGNVDELSACSGPTRAAQAASAAARSALRRVPRTVPRGSRAGGFGRVGARWGA